MHRQFPRHLPTHFFDKMRLYSSVGIKYAEIGNEPNLPVEWEREHQDHLSWRDEGYVAIIADTWLLDAINTTNSGMWPGFYALAPTDWGEYRPHQRFSSVRFYERIFQAINSDRSMKADFLGLFKNHNAWLAVHASTYEHPPDFDPFPEGQQVYDMCLRGYEVPRLYMKMLFGIDPVTISTEGGVFCFDSNSMVGHKRLKDHVEHGDRTVEMFSWIEENSPLEAMCPWLICNVGEIIGHEDWNWSRDGWYRRMPTGTVGSLPVVNKMKQTAKGERIDEAEKERKSS